jgi:TM2 domain-containing membrane protein YozV
MSTPPATINQGSLLLLAVFNLDRFYLDQPVEGLWKLITFGGFFLWNLYDVIRYTMAALSGSEDIPSTTRYTIDPTTLSLGYYVAICVLIWYVFLTTRFALFRSIYLINKMSQSR